EDHPTNPVDFNGVDKLAAEKYYFLYQQLYGIPAVSLRINNTFGPRCQMRNSDYGIVNWFVRLAMENRPISLYGGGSQTRDYNYVEDVADAFVLAIEKKEADGNMYLLGSGVETPLLSMTKKIVALAQSKSPINLVDWSEERKRIEIGNFCVSIEKIRRELGWNPSTSLDDGLKKTIEFYRRRKNEYF
ncbi:MAG: GDP-mannose 4,6-dehydratase, partial [Candidatus Diapherotrites archaeon]|nr:GDP-mannose 4,6-dehydratase [Candidatus Diapherotrites archaeon]